MQLWGPENKKNWKSESPTSVWVEDSGLITVVRRSMPQHMGMTVKFVSSAPRTPPPPAIHSLLATGLRTLSSDPGIYFCSFLPPSHCMIPCRAGPGISSTGMQSARSLLLSSPQCIAQWWCTCFPHAPVNSGVSTLVAGPAGWTNWDIGSLEQMRTCPVHKPQK